MITSFKGKNPADLQMAVRKDGGEIDVITASTISSRAYVDAVARAYQAYMVAAHGADVPQTTPVEEDDSPTTVNVTTKDGLTVGYTVESEADGFRGTIRLLVSFLADGTIADIAVVEQSETPEYGGVIAEGENPMLASLKGKKMGEVNLSLKSDSGDVDAISGSTVTSRAYAKAVGRACLALESFKNTEDAR